MKRILCPTDFSKASENAIEYAAKYAQQYNHSLELINVQMLSATHPISSGMRVVENNYPTVNKLKEICNEVSHEFNISCDFMVEPTIDPLEDVLAQAESQDQVLIMGTNGIDDPYQYVFGTNSYHTVKKTKLPMFIIPENAEYKIPQKVIFAWDYKRTSESYMQLKELIPANTEIVFLHLDQKESEIGNDIFNAHKEEFIAAFGEDQNVKFKHLYSEDKSEFAEKIDEFVKDAGADMLVISYYERGIFSAPFHGSILKQLSAISAYPILTLHTSEV
jgi:nucleotide-binding universal stress UspA family protein